MACILMEGFDYWNTGITSTMVPASEWTYMGGPIIDSSLTGGHGSAGYMSNSYGPLMMANVLDASEEDVSLVFSTRCNLVRPGAGTSWDIVSLGGDAAPDVTLHVSGTLHITVGVDDAGGISVWRGPGVGSGSSATWASATGTLLGSSAPGIIPGGGGRYTHFIEIAATLDDSSGSVVIRLDEVEILNLSGVDTKNGGTGTVFNGVWVWSENVYDDLFLLNSATPGPTGFQGDCTVTAVQANGAGSSTDWTAGAPTGNNWDNTNSQNAYGDPLSNESNSAAVTDLLDLYAFRDLSYGGEYELLAVQVCCRAYKTDSGSRSIALAAKAPTTTGLSADKALTQSFTEYAEVYQQTPDNAAWTFSAFNAAEFGVQSRP